MSVINQNTKVEAGRSHPGFSFLRGVFLLLLSLVFLSVFSCANEQRDADTGNETAAQSQPRLEEQFAEQLDSRFQALEKEQAEKTADLREDILMAAVAVFILNLLVSFALYRRLRGKIEGKGASKKKQKTSKASAKGSSRSRKSASKSSRKTGASGRSKKASSQSATAKAAKSEKKGEESPKDEKSSAESAES